MGKVVLVCAQCRTEFARYPSQSGPFCSRICAVAARRDRKPVNALRCDHCSRTFYVEYPSDMVGRRFCSRACQAESRRVDGDGSKKCGKCGEIKPLDAFRRNASTVSGRSCYCKVCRQGETQTHPARRYGLTEEEYDVLYEKQLGFCAICHQSNVRRALNVDHNHETGEVRGLLCDRCNSGLGLFRDMASNLRRAAEYLEERGGATVYYLSARIVEAS